MDDEDDRQPGRDQPAVIWAAGASAVVLIAILVVAVIRTSDSSHPRPFVPAAPDADTTSQSAFTTPSSTTSYPVPSVVTSQDSGVPATTGAPTVDDPTLEESTTSTTVANPYGTTTPTNAGHV